jgi:chorismate mutase-like protein
MEESHADRSSETRSSLPGQAQSEGIQGGPSEPEDPELATLRDRISQVDDDLIRLIGERRNLVIEIGRVKARLGLPVMDPGREAKVVRKAAQRARELGVDEEMTRDVIWRIMAAARAEQENRPAGWPEPPPDG